MSGTNLGPELHFAYIHKGGGENAYEMSRTNFRPDYHFAFINKGGEESAYKMSRTKFGARMRFTKNEYTK